MICLQVTFHVANAPISGSNARTLLHLPNFCLRLVDMTVSASGVNLAAQPGLASSLLVPTGQVPKLVAVIIRVAVPGPA